MGVGPFRRFQKKQISMIQNGEETGKNFLTPFAYQYAKTRVANKQKNETIEEYRLFNNLLSSQPMAFNLFCPLIQKMQEGKADIVTQIVQAIFPLIPIHKVTEVGLEYLHTDIDNYLSDKTAMDAIIRYQDSSQRPCIIAIETKYTDVLGTNSAQIKALTRQKALLQQLGHFTQEAETQLLADQKPISQIYRNYLLSECYRLREPAHESYSVILSPADHPTTQQEVASLRQELKAQYRYKVQDITLEHFLEQAIATCPHDMKQPFIHFQDRYLNFGKLTKQ